MDASTKSPLLSPEVAAFRQEYKYLLRYVDRPVELARLLFAEGIISSETKNAITSDEDVEGKRAILDAAEHALVQASDREAAFRSLVEVLTKVYKYTNDMIEFVDGEHTKGLWLKLISGVMGMYVRSSIKP